MAASSPLIKAAACLGLAVLAGASVLVPPTPVEAAPNHPRFNFHSNHHDRGAPYDIDPDPCLQQGGRNRGGSAACPGQQFELRRGDHRTHRPGSNAFGLQFDTDD